MKKLLPLLLFLNTVNSNNFKMKNDLFEIEGSSDKNGNITYAELKKCNHNPIDCQITKDILKSIPSESKSTSIEALRTKLQKSLEVVYNTEKSQMNLCASLTLIAGKLSMDIRSSTNNVINKTQHSPVEGIKILFLANITHGLISAALDNKSKFNKGLIATDVILGIANAVFIAKAIALAASPFATTALLGLGIARSAFSIFFRTSEPKTTVTITETENKD